MRLRIFYVLLTLVVCAKTASAAPLGDSPPDKSAETPGETPSLFSMENISITNVSKSSGITEYALTFSKDDYYHTYKQNVHVFGGFMLPFVDSTDDDDLMHYVLGVSYELPKSESPKWEAEAVWSTLSVGQLSAMRKRIFNEKKSFRPHFRYGVTYKIAPEEKLASAANAENFLARLGVGFEDIRRPPKSIRFDLDAAIGTEDIWVMFFAGYAWGW